VDGHIEAIRRWRNVYDSVRSAPEHSGDELTHFKT
jgi:hypothetical protein